MTHDRRQKIYLLTGPALRAGACKKLLFPFSGGQGYNVALDDSSGGTYHLGPDFVPVPVHHHG